MEEETACWVYRRYHAFCPKRLRGILTIDHIRRGDIMNKKIGTLYGIGVGPGDPELIPLKSVRILSRVDVIFAAASTKNSHSLAVNIAESHIPAATPIKILSFPMTKDEKKTCTAWAENARIIINELVQGRDAAFLTVGDSLTFSTFGYILKHVKTAAPYVTIESIPGITSYQAAAARLNTPLVEGEESLLVTSGVKGGDRLRHLSCKPETVVFLKAYRNVQDIICAVDEADLYPNCVGISKCGLPGEEIVTDLKEFSRRPPDYWTLIIAKQKKKVTPLKIKSIMKQHSPRHVETAMELTGSI
jgi:precorrin-2/cobalt-factor-2 C20-methyltransferase